MRASQRVEQPGNKENLGRVEGPKEGTSPQYKRENYKHMPESGYAVQGDATSKALSTSEMAISRGRRSTKCETPERSWGL